jgi:hypothetical protein
MEAKFEDLWNDLEKSFNWKKVYKIMKSVDWHWRDYGIPCPKMLRDTAKGLCQEAFDRNTKISSGGFIASYDKEYLCLKLMFVIESY